MSTSNSGVGFSGAAVKSRNYIKKNAESMFSQSFGDLPHGTIYRDPAGWKTDGEAVELQKDRYEQMRTEPIPALSDLVGSDETPTVFNAWNRLQKNGFSLRETTQEIRKNLDTGDWTLPLDIIPEIFTINPERLPMADMMTRVATQDDEVVATSLADHPSIEWGLETTDDTEGSYTYSDPTYDDSPTFPVEGWGAATRLEDKLILASSNLRNAESSQEQAFVRAMEQELERQIILGTDNNSGGFDGLEQFVNDGSYRGGNPGGDADVGAVGSANASAYETATREIIDAAEFAGAPRENLAVVCGFDWHKEVRKSLVSQQRFEGNVQEVAAGFSAMTLDDVPVLKTHAIERISDSSSDTNFAYTVNMDSTYLAMLQEVSVKPLAKVAPQEQMAVDAYGVLVSEDDGAHVQAAEADAT
jgi:hypothetical protein